MTSKDDDFRPRLGRIRSSGGRVTKRYLGRLYATIEKAKPGAFAKRSGRRFTGARIGRGAGVGAALAYRHPFASSRARRVAVKIRSVRMGGTGRAKAAAHLRYIQRDGTDRANMEAEAGGRLYGPRDDAVDGKAFLDTGQEDRHQFRIILSPEDAGDLEDLRVFTRDVMAAAEGDLGTGLDWVAVNHFNTDHPHTHVVLRGKDDQGRDLVIARDYICHGFRTRAEERAGAELGPRGDLDIAQSRASEVDGERFTKLDRDLAARAARGLINFEPPRTVYDRFQSTLLKARLKALQGMQLASREKRGWRLSPDLESTLRDMGRRGDIIRSMGAALGEEFAPSRFREFEADAPVKIIGRVAGSGPADDSHEKRFLAIDGADGNQWRAVVDLAPGATPPTGAIVEISRAPAVPRSSDRVISAIAERSGGVYSRDLHATADPSTSEEFLEAHKRRLEALRRMGIVERERDGSWKIPADFLDRAAAYEAQRSAAKLRTLSWVALDQLIEARGQTILDDVLADKLKIERAAAGFGRTLDDALSRRHQWLLAQGLAIEVEGGLAVDKVSMRALERESMAATASKISQELQKEFAPVSEGQTISGIYRRQIDLPSGRLAIIERSKEFTLVPWRDVLDKRRGREIFGVVRGSKVDWDFGRGRGGPSR